MTASFSLMMKSMSLYPDKAAASAAVETSSIGVPKERDPTGRINDRAAARVKGTARLNMVSILFCEYYLV